MRLSRRSICFGFLLALTSATGCTRGDPIAMDRVAVGSRTSSDDFSVTGGNLAIHRDKPGVMFGTVSGPKKPSELSYVVLFRYRPATDSFSFTSEAKANGLPAGGGEVKNAYLLDGKRIEVWSRFELSPDRASVAKETLTIGGKEMDPAAGRVFLVDIEAKPPVYRQLKVELPTDVPTLEKTEEVDRFAAALLKSLEEKSAEVRDGLK